MEVIGASRSLPHGLVRRARMILLTEKGVSMRDTARRAKVTPWRKRFRKHRLTGLHDQLKSGRPRSHTDDYIAALLNTALSRQPKAATHWSVRDLADETGISKSTVQRYLKSFSVQPHRSKSIKLSTDLFFIEKMRDVVGEYLNPPENGLVLCVDEKSQVQALERTQPMLPTRLGHVEDVTHDYVRHGITTLFAALDIADGQVPPQCKPRHRHQEFLSFLRGIEVNLPPHLDVNLIVDNYGTHNHTKVRAWFARRSRFRIHYTSTYSSWLSQVERRFVHITQKAIRRGSLNSATDLRRKIEPFVSHWNQNPRPFVWTATADSIFAKLERFSNVTCGTSH